ncbi:MAG TPA: sodium:calcium antiporter, partial [Thermoanaerobaculia bacterium]|nr:sodium:calcium antiporter [Thermoanaerobaculia bacterium]
RALGVSEMIIGLTVVAAGTSLPELATSVVASVRGERDIAVGNVVGSNLFNLLAVLGIASIFSGEGLAVPSSVLELDFPVMIGVAIVCLPVFFTGSRIERWEGALFVAGWIAYTLYLILQARAHPLLDPYGRALLIVILPLGIAILLMPLLAGLKARSR